MTFEQFVATIGIVAVVTIMVEVIKRAANWSSETTARFAPLLAVIFGAILGLAFYLGAGPGSPWVARDALVALLFGFVQGASAVGLYDLGGGAAIKAVVGEHTPNG